MELLSLILIIFVALALSLSYVSFWIALKTMREIAALTEKIEHLLDEIVVLKNESRVLMTDIGVLELSLEEAARSG